MRLASSKSALGAYHICASLASRLLAVALFAPLSLKSGKSSKKRQRVLKKGIEREREFSHSIITTTNAQLSASLSLKGTSRQTYRSRGSQMSGFSLCPKATASSVYANEISITTFALKKTLSKVGEFSFFKKK